MALTSKGCCECGTPEAMWELPDSVMCDECHTERRETLEAIIDLLRKETNTELKRMLGLLSVVKQLDPGPKPV